MYTVALHYRLQNTLSLDKLLPIVLYDLFIVLVPTDVCLYGSERKNHSNQISVR